MKLGLGANDLSLLGPKIGWAVTVELDARTQVYELHLVEPARVHLDVEPEQDVEGGVGFDLDGRARAVHDRACPCAGGCGCAQDG